MDGKTQIRARITHVGSEYRKDVTSGTCELCITDWSARVRDISFEFTDVNTGSTWQATTPTLHVGRWNDVWELRVNPFHLSKALAHVTLVVDTDRLHDADGRTLIALGILEAVEACTRASEMVERLDGTCIHDDDRGEEKLVPEPGRISGDSDEGYTALVDARNVRKGRSFLSRKARKAKREYVEK